MTDLRRLAADLEDLRGDVDSLNALAEHALVNATPVPTTTNNPYLAPSTARTRAGGAHVWHSLTRTEAADAWTTLTTWVDWLLDRYHLEDTLPACWYRHGALVDELDALRAAWTGAYLNPKPHPAEAATWHQHLDRALTRIRDWDRYGCASGTHRDDIPSPTDEQASEARLAYLHADLQARSGPPQVLQPANRRNEPCRRGPGDLRGDLSGDTVAF